MPRPLAPLRALRPLLALLALHALAALAAHVQCAPKTIEKGPECGARIQLNEGWACGVLKSTENRTHFASFLGLPYAKQPVGARRFSELEAVEPWEGIYDATEEGPVCPQHDTLYGPLLRTTNMSEACIYANIHVPLYALPEYRTPKPARELQLPYETGLFEKEENPGLPILVFIHGGGFAFGSGGVGLHGPEYLINKDIIVITFNYRINVFGFLSLNSSSIPGNNGLRDIVTLLKWVQRNAKSFGGDPNDVTLAGQSAGASCAHLLSMSSAADGLFRRAILMSGTGTHSFFTASPVYAEYIANLLLTSLNINATNPDDIHKELISMPLEEIMEANKQLQDSIGLTAFLPVVESPFPGFTTILDDDPDVLLSKGRGNNIPLIIGFTNAECEIFRTNFEKIDMLGRLKENPLLILSIDLLYKLPPETSLGFAQKVEKRYFDGDPTMDKYLKSCSDTFYIYPAMKLAEKRAEMDGAPVFLYQFGYDADFSVLKESKGLHFNGAGHIEDMTFIFRANSMQKVKGFFPPTHKDQLMVDWMTNFVKNFMYCNDPTCSQRSSSWPAESKDYPVQYQNIVTPMQYRYQKATKEQQETIKFFDSLQMRTI